MIWNTSRASTRIPTKDGALAVRVDGDPHKAPLLLCQALGGLPGDQPAPVVPTLVLDDGTAIGEVTAIMRYLDEAFPEKPLLGAGAEALVRNRVQPSQRHRLILSPGKFDA